MTKTLPILLLAIACEPDTAMDVPDAAPAPAPAWRAEHIGPQVGFVSAVAFAPGSANVAWFSGDDASGIYRSTDGGNTLAPVPSAPLDWSSWRFAFSSNGQRIVAPAYYGRGVAISDDAGATWRVVTEGLPQVGSPTKRSITDVVITPGNEILVATGSGLYRSTDGARFARATASALATATELTVLIRTSTGYLMGSANGRSYSSTDGNVWLEQTDADGPDITDLAEGRQGVYVATKGGQLLRFSTEGLEVLIDPGADARFADADAMKIAVAPIGNQDRIYVGTQVAVSAARRTAGKVFVSSNGGATFEPSRGLAGSSVFQLAVSPTDAAHALVGTLGEGAFVTRNGGLDWTPVTGDLRATAVIGFAQNPGDPSRIAMTSVDTGPGTPSLWERVGGTWKQQASLVEDAISLVYDDSALIAGGGGTTADIPAIRRSPVGGDGPFATEVQPSERVMRLVRTSRGIYAAGDSLRRRDSTGTWATLRARNPGLTFAFTDVSEANGSLLACGEAGMMLSASGDFTDAQILEAPDKLWYSCTVAPNGRVVATTFANGEMWSAPDLTAARQSTGWTRITTPLDGTTVLSVVTLEQQWLIGGGGLLDGAVFGARSGVYASSDFGVTWTAIDANIWPSRIAWRLHRGEAANEVFAPMWGGGLWRLVYE